MLRYTRDKRHNEFMPLPAEEKKIWDAFVQAKEQLAEAREKCKQAERELSVRSDEHKAMIKIYSRAKAEFDKVYANDDPMNTNFAAMSTPVDKPLVIKGGL
jgi:hypothetical protein